MSNAKASNGQYLALDNPEWRERGLGCSQSAAVGLEILQAVTHIFDAILQDGYRCRCYLDFAFAAYPVIL
jgi:hypothetical protein